MNKAFERMKKLLEGIGLSFNEGGISFAELYAYARGLELIDEGLNKAESIIFMDTDDREELARYSDMLKIDRERFTAEELKEEIERRLSSPFSECSTSQAQRDFSRVGSGNISFTRDYAVLEGVKLEDLYEALKYLRAYTPYFSDWKYSGNGERLNFDMRDSVGLSFNDFDRYGFKFSFLDSLRSDIFE